MARYRSKDETDLAWNDLRRRLTLQVDAEVRAVRERMLDKVLTAAWSKFQESLEQGEILQIESQVAAFVGETMTRSIGSKAAELETLLAE